MGMFLHFRFKQDFNGQRMYIAAQGNICLFSFSVSTYQADFLMTIFLMKINNGNINQLLVIAIMRIMQCLFVFNNVQVQKTILSLISGE